MKWHLFNFSFLLNYNTKSLARTNRDYCSFLINTYACTHELIIETAVDSISGSAQKFVSILIRVHIYRTDWSEEDFLKGSKDEET